MPSSVIERDRIGDRRRGPAAGGGIAATLAAIGGALLMLLALAAAVAFAADAFGRLAAGRPLLAYETFDRLALVVGIGIALCSLLALPAALAAPFARAGDPPLRSHSALALVPGALVALAVLVAATAAVLAMSAGLETGATLVYRRVVSTFSEIVYLFIPIAVMLAAALAGARTPEATAAAAAPTVMAGLTGMIGGLSIVSLLVGLLLPLFAAGLLLAVLYAAAPARAVTPWLIGIALAFGVSLLTATGLLTPTEAIGLVAAFGIPVALFVRSVALRQPTGALLRQAATETVSLVLVLAASATAGTVLGLAQIKPGLGEELLSSRALMIGGGVAFMAASCLATPALTLGIALPLVFAGFRADQVDQAHVGMVLILLGLAAVAARAGRRAPGVGLPRAAAAAAAAAFAILAVAVAFAPDLALAPVRGLLR
jgi:hypothetical protein